MTPPARSSATPRRLAPAPGAAIGSGAVPLDPLSDPDEDTSNQQVLIGVLLMLFCAALLGWAACGGPEYHLEVVETGEDLGDLIDYGRLATWYPRVDTLVQWHYSTSVHFRGDACQAPPHMLEASTVTSARIGPDGQLYTARHAVSGLMGSYLDQQGRCIPDRTPYEGGWMEVTATGIFRGPYDADKLRVVRR